MPVNPQKRWYRPRNVLLALFTMFLIAGAWCSLELYRAFSAVPGPIADYRARYEQMVAHHQSEVRDEPNAWPYLTDTIAMYHDAMFPENQTPIEHDGLAVSIDFRVLAGPLREGDYVHFREPEPVARAAAEGALARLESSGLYERFAALANMRHSARPSQDGPLFDWTLLELGAMRQFATINVIRMHRAHQAGHDLAIVAPFEQGLAIARHGASQIWSMDHKVACTIVESVTRELRCELSERTISAPVLRQLLDAMNRQLPLPPREIAVEGDRLMALDTLDRVHTAGGRVIVPALVELTGGSIFGPATPPGPLSNLRALRMARKPETIRLCNEFYDAAVINSRLRRADQMNNPRLAEMSALLDEQPKRYMALGMVIVYQGQASSDRGLADLAIAGTRLMLAIELFRAERGFLPARLEDLVPDHLPELPQDQWASDGFRYRLTDTGYLLYSVGADLIDNDGTPDPGNPGRATHPKGTGYDYVFNQPRLPLKDQLIFPDNEP